MDTGRNSQKVSWPPNLLYTMAIALILRNFASLDLERDHVKHLLKILNSQLATKFTTHMGYNADF